MMNIDKKIIKGIYSKSIEFHAKISRTKNIFDENLNAIKNILTRPDLLLTKINFSSMIYITKIPINCTHYY
jgi:hypothetical protein